jgi:hypothetical protein
MSMDMGGFPSEKGIEFFNDGNRWLSRHLYYVPLQPFAALAVNLAASGSGYFATTPMFSPSNDFWIEDMLWTSLVNGATNNSTHYWQVTLAKYVSSLPGTTIVTGDTQNDGTGSLYTAHVTPVNALLGSGYQMINVNITKVNSPSNLYIPSVVITGRMVG